jgi:hypothetical protein
LLCELTERFETLAADTADVGFEESVEHAAAQLLPLVVERTDTNEAWYNTFATLVTWYLESRGHDPERAGAAVHRVTSGRFQSWVEPEPEVAQAACAELAREVKKALADDPRCDDATTPWLATRATAFEYSLPDNAGSTSPVRIDGHRRYIDGPEHARDPERARRMTAALDACRASARAGEPLTLENLCAWQALVLGQEQVTFRTTDAFAKGGRDRYPFAPDTEARFVAALAEANPTADGPSPVVRAARGYLDVCFFHPFADGNARAARLVLDHVLTRAGLALHSIEPLLVVSRSGRDARGAWHFAFLVSYLCGPSLDE